VIDDEDQEDDDEQVISWTEQEVQDGRRSDKGERGVVFLDDDVDDKYQGWSGVFLDASSGRCEKEADVCLMEDCDKISDTWQCRHCTLINTVCPPNDRRPSGLHNGSTTDYGNSRGVYVSRSNHPGGVVHAFADGSVTFIADSIAIDVYQGLGSRNGGETVAAP
jgi:hypothetical protein